MALAALGAPAAAADREVHRDGFWAEFHLKSENGYDVSVFSTGHKRVILTASKGGVSASYLVPGRASRKRIDADFGPFGEISVKFDPAARRPTRKGRLCPGPRPIAMAGTFRGTIRFVGERGFTEVDASRARGSYFRSFRQVCEKPEKRHRSRVPRPPGAGQSELRPVVTTLLAETDANGRHLEVGFLGLGFAPGPKLPTVEFLSIGIAGSQERVGHVVVSRSALTDASSRSLHLSAPEAEPETATLSLPKPFSGTATHRKEDGSAPTWTGTLGVRLPGLGTVPLAGTEFHSGLCRTTGFDAFEACLKRLAGNPAKGRRSEFLALLQGSGSQSQFRWDARLSWSR